MSESVVHLDIRRFALPDMPRIMEIEIACFPHDAYCQETFLHWQREWPQFFRVAQSDDYVTGYIIGTMRQRQGSIVSIGVDPATRRGGIGRMLVLETLRRLRDSGVHLVQLESRFNNLVSIHFWRSMGFSADGIVPGYYADGTNALKMRRSLKK